MVAANGQSATVTEIASASREYAEKVATLGEARIAWFAGWVCADGSIGDAGGGRPRIKFTLTDFDVLERFSQMFGNKPSPPYANTGLGHKPIADWQISGWRCLIILKAIEPWLSERYAMRMHLLDEWTPRAHCGQKVSPEEVAHIKWELAKGEWGAGRALATRYGVSSGMISSIKSGRSWADIEPKEKVAA